MAIATATVIFPSILPTSTLAKGFIVKTMDIEKKPVDWSTYDRVSPTELTIGEEKKPFKGIIIGHRKFLGLFDYAGYPFVIFALVSGYPLYAYKTIAAITPTWLGTTLFYFLIVLGVVLAVLLFLYIYKAKKTNDSLGTANVFLNLETRELGIRDYNGKGMVLPLDKIEKPMIFRLFSLQIGPISIKLYARLILKYHEDGKNKYAFVHFMDDPETTAHLINDILHEKQ